MLARGDIPIMTFDKVGREKQNAFELLDEIENALALDASPMTWLVGMGDGSSLPAYTQRGKSPRIVPAPGRNFA